MYVRRHHHESDRAQTFSVRSAAAPTTLAARTWAQDALPDARFVGFAQAVNDFELASGNSGVGTVGEREHSRLCLQGDRRTANNDAQSLSRSRSEAGVPYAPDGSMRQKTAGLMAQLNALQGPVFDTAFANAQLERHDGCGSPIRRSLAERQKWPAAALRAAHPSQSPNAARVCSAPRRRPLIDDPAKAVAARRLSGRDIRDAWSEPRCWASAHAALLENAAHPRRIVGGTPRVAWNEGEARASRRDDQVSAAGSSASIKLIVVSVVALARLGVRDDAGRRGSLAGPAFLSFRTPFAISISPESGLS